MFECDVRKSADGVLFLCHDERLGRTISGEGSILERSWDEIARLDAGSWLSPDFAGERVPNLEMAWRYCASSNCCLNLEMKANTVTGRDIGRTLGSVANQLMVDLPLVAPPLISSFEPTALEGARESAPAVPRALLLENLDNDWLQIAASLACVAVVLHHPLIQHATVKLARSKSLRVLAYTPNDQSEWGRLIDLGVDGLITDRMDVAGIMPNSPDAPFVTPI